LKWLQIGLTVEEELAEPVAEVLSRHAPGGVALSPVDPGQESGPSLIEIHAYVEADEKTDAVRQRVERDVWFLGRIRPLPDPEFTWIEDSDWEDAWRDHFSPLLVGRSLRIQPAWLESPSDDRLDVFIDPGMAFGTGTHPSTQLCLELLEELVRPNDLIADLGCGSGILSIAAIKLGAAQSLAYDTDPIAVSVCGENALANQVGDHVQARLGSLDELIQDTRQSGPPQVILANIYLNVLTDLLDGGIGTVLAETGKLILAGILQSQADDLAAYAQRLGMKLVQARQREDWTALVFET
jgi:ribosomal protein L11 methyltransferase